MLPSSILIPAFPTDINRDSFGQWLSGFTDGEAHFSASIHEDKRRKLLSPRTSFIITLRSDDSPALHLIHSYWQCGVVNDLSNYSKLPNAKPQTRYHVNRISDLRYILVPHFSKYPLYAKKAKEFSIWKQAVEFQHSLSFRQRPHGTNGLFQGQRWTVGELAHFRTLCLQITEQRSYKDR